MMRISLAFAALILGASHVHAEGFNPAFKSGSTLGNPVQRASVGNGNVEIDFYNHCPFPVRVGQNGVGEIQYLEPYQAREHWIGNDAGQHLALAYYAYKADAFPGFGHMSLAEFSFNTDWHRLDFYNVSLVDGYNLPIDIAPIGTACNATGCNVDLNPGCPESQRIYKDGWVIACSKFGDRDTPWNPAAQYFANACSDVYSWSKDDSKVEGCDGQDYVVTFCK